LRLPDYLKRPIIDTEKTKKVRKVLKECCLNTVCESARCPNKNECYQKNTATFLIMGNFCTRNCRFCNISCEKAFTLDKNEPKNVAKAAKELGLNYVVITSVTRDDLPDGGAEHFVKCINEIKKNVPPSRGNRNLLISKGGITPHPTPPPQGGRENVPKIEILTPDFKGDKKALDTIIKSPVDVFNHNIETVPRLYKNARPQADYQRSLDVLKYVKENSKIPIKTGLMVGLGETFEEIEQVLVDLKSIGIDILTIGQYIAPSKEHLAVNEYYSLEKFEQLKRLTEKIGIKNYQIGPLVRSSYNAFEIFR